MMYINDNLFQKISSYILKKEYYTHENIYVQQKRSITNLILKKRNKTLLQKRYLTTIYGYWSIYVYWTIFGICWITQQQQDEKLAEDPSSSN